MSELQKQHQRAGIGNGNAPVIVELSVEPDPDRQIVVTRIGPNNFPFTPDQARQLAVLLWDSADEADRNPASIEWRVVPPDNKEIGVEGFCQIIFNRPCEGIAVNHDGLKQFLGDVAKAIGKAEAVDMILGVTT